MFSVSLCATYDKSVHLPKRTVQQQTIIFEEEIESPHIFRVPRENPTFLQLNHFFVSAVLKALPLSPSPVSIIGARYIPEGGKNIFCSCVYHQTNNNGFFYPNFAVATIIVVFSMLPVIFFL